MRPKGTVLFRASLLALLPAVAAGCGIGHDEFTTEARQDKGLVVILPGILGPIAGASGNIRRGLDSAGVEHALAVVNWGKPIPVLGPLLNQMDVIGNRFEGARIAEVITQYQDAHPDRPVFVIGHSGGGGIAVFVAESMPEGRYVDGLILLAASIGENYDLTKALSHCRRGIVNFYNPADSILDGGTTITSTIDGARGPSAGLNGFQRAYPRLYQEQVSSVGDTHFAATQPHYVSTFVAPWVLNWIDGG